MDTSSYTQEPSRKFLKLGLTGPRRLCAAVMSKTCTRMIRNILQSKICVNGNNQTPIRNPPTTNSQLSPTSETFGPRFCARNIRFVLFSRLFKNSSSPIGRPVVSDCLSLRQASSSFLSSPKNLRKSP